MTLHTYLPQDRLRAIANGITLPDSTSGSAVFADISGFTALTETLRDTYGDRRGEEELTKQLGVVYTALIAEIEKYGGSVISFAGDSMLCWFDSGVGSQGTETRAVNAAFGMQTVMKSFEKIKVGKETVPLTLKVAIATGPARRFVVGDPEIMKLDVLVGDTVTRTATAEHLAQKGEVLLDETTVNSLGEALKVKEGRDEGNERFAVIEQESGGGSQESPLPSILRMPPPTKLMSWMHYAVFEREQYGQGGFLTEFRPCVALFVRFTGIDYDSDSAESELDNFIRTVQGTASRYEGTLMDITIGDKGSYAYVNFGALSAHEDDSRRAVKTALELRNKTELQLQMGITQGLMRVGAYGGETRKVFGALGDDVNLAARLMTTAKEDEILLSSHVHKAVMEQFTFEPRPPLPMKGKAEPLPVFAVTGESQKRALRLQEPNYSLPMVGRVDELKLIEEKLDLVAQEGKSQVIGIVAEAGLGKSRLVAEVIRNARRKGFVGFGGACQSDGIYTPYLAWKSIWQAFFDVDPEMSERRLVRWLKGEIEDRAPSRVDAMPLLNVVLDLNIPDNDFTQNLEPKIRQSALHALLEDCLKAQATDEPTLIVIEDLHWIDALSHDLLEGLARALAGHAVCFVLAYRPPQLERLRAPRIEALEQFTRIELHELTTAEAESAVRAKLTQLYPARGGALPEGLVEALMVRAQGNPFYLEELLNYVRDRGLDPSDIQNIELPDSLHTLILSRIDGLSEAEKTTLRAASIVGRLFRAKWLTGYYPELGSFPQVKAALDELDKLEITPLDSEPELTYLFKHVVTHEVTYESLPFATRARLHEQLARYLESADAPVETIAFHYGRSENKGKQKEYLRKAGEASQKNYANEAALEYYGQLLPLLKNNTERAQIYLKRGDVLELMGKWNDADTEFRAALEAAEDNLALTAGAQFALGKLNRFRGDYKPALAFDWLAKAKQAYARLEDTAGLAQVLIETGTVFWRKGEYEEARKLLNEGLGLARETGDKLITAMALNNLGNVVSAQGDHAAAQALYEESLALRREIGDRVGISTSLNGLGSVALAQGNYSAAGMVYKESLALMREMGIKWGIMIPLVNLGLVALAQGDYPEAQAFSEEGLVLTREMRDKEGIAISLNNLGNVAVAQGDYTAARTLFEETLALKREMGDKGGMAISLINLGLFTYTQDDYSIARELFEESLVLAKEIGDKNMIAGNLFGLGLVDLAEDKPETRENILQSLRLHKETGNKLHQTSCLIGAAGLVLSKGNAQFAAKLLGVVKSALKAINAVMESEMKGLHDQTLAKARKALGKEAFQSAFEEGSKWSLDDAVKKVLDDNDM